MKTQQALVYIAKPLPYFVRGCTLAHGMKHNWTFITTDIGRRKCFHWCFVRINLIVWWHWLLAYCRHFKVRQGHVFSVSVCKVWVTKFVSIARSFKGYNSFIELLFLWWNCGSKTMRFSTCSIVSQWFRLYVLGCLLCNFAEHTADRTWDISPSY